MLTVSLLGSTGIARCVLCVMCAHMLAAHNDVFRDLCALSISSLTSKLFLCVITMFIMYFLELTSFSVASVSRRTALVRGTLGVTLLGGVGSRGVSRRQVLNSTSVHLRLTAGLSPHLSSLPDQCSHQLSLSFAT